MGKRLEYDSVHMSDSNLEASKGSLWDRKLDLWKGRMLGNSKDYYSVSEKDIR